VPDFLLNAQGFSAFLMINGGSFSDPSAFDVKAYVNLTFLPFILLCFFSERPQSGASLCAISLNLKR
jgi:hypothetical protein